MLLPVIVCRGGNLPLPLLLWTSLRRMSQLWSSWWWCRNKKKSTLQSWWELNRRRIVRWGSSFWMRLRKVLGRSTTFTVKVASTRGFSVFHQSCASVDNAVARGEVPQPHASSASQSHWYETPKLSTWRHRTGHRQVRWSTPLVQRNERL